MIIRRCLAYAALCAALVLGVGRGAWELGLASPDAAHAASDPQARRGVLIGVNVVNPQWDPRVAQESTLDALRDAGVRTIRVPLVPPTGGTYDGSVDYIRRAASRGLEVILIIYPAYAPGAPERPRVSDEPEIWPLPPLSMSDEGVLATTYGPVLRKIDEQGLKLAAIEFGNEINWTAFNGEFEVPGRGIVLGYDDLLNDSLGRRVAAGYRAYLRSLAELKRIRDGLTLNRSTPLLAAGFADYGQAGDKTGRPLDAVSVKASLKYMRVFGLDTLVDGYSIHTYPDGAQSPAERRSRLIRDVLDECGPFLGIGKPCWLTEWGFPSASPCGDDDQPRPTLVNAFRQDVRPWVEQGRLKALVYYSWGGRNDPYALTRCGSLMSGGRAAISPYPAPDGR